MGKRFTSVWKSRVAPRNSWISPSSWRDYSVTNVDEIKAYVAQARAKRYEGFYGGVHPTENKEFTEHLALQKFPEPDTVIIPLAMHIGAPANPVVQPATP